MPKRRLGLATTASVFVVVSACRPMGRPQAGDLSIDTLLGSRILITASAETVEGNLGTIRPVVRIGGVDDGPGAFGRVSDVWFDRDRHRVLVADALASEIRAFGLSSEYQRVWGRAGEGPGEFRLLTGILVDTAGRIWAEDAGLKRLTLFKQDHTVLTFPNLQRDWGGNASWLAILSEEGDLLDMEHFSRYASADGTRREPEVVRAALGETGAVRLDSLALPPSTEPALHAVERSGYTELVRPPFWPSRLVALSPKGTVWINDVFEYVVHQIDFKGDTLVTIRVDLPPREVAPSRRDSASEASGVPKSTIPRREQVLRSLRVDTEGRLWAELRNSPAGSRLWDVWTLPDRRLRVSSSIDYERVPQIGIWGDTVVGVTFDELGRASVVIGVLDHLGP